MIDMNKTKLSICYWEIEKKTIARTSCGKTTNVYDDNPNGWEYCPYCGLRIKVAEVYEDED